MANKIKYGISKCYYAKITETNGAITYGTPVALPGAVSISLDQQGETNTFYADNIAYYTSNANNGYQGDLELALLPDSFRTDILGEELDTTSGAYMEYGNAPTVEFALLFQFEGDENATRHCLYRCVASRPSVSGSTKEESIEPQTETVTITAMARESDELVKARCPHDATAYANWFTSVVEPA
jgi:phi13 family phage major tail protein